MSSNVNLKRKETGRPAPPSLSGAPRHAAMGRSYSQEVARATAELAECTCPDYCERDHQNE